ncbi:MAG: response regulator containing a CheY-like receiver domain and a GGDEF domain-containing protein [bacterium]|nr:MAG: response regulator containing a CheY-like receiver domain and a GGDEF domain-containing protein [bacterium]
MSSNQTSDNDQLEVDRGPIFDLDAPPTSDPAFELDLNDIAYTTAEQNIPSPTTNESTPFKASGEKGFDLSGPTFDLTQAQQHQQPLQAEEMNLDVQDDPYESTQIMGSASRKELQAAYATYSPAREEKADTSESESSSHLELDVDLTSEQSSKYNQKQSVSSSNYQDSPSEIHYDDFTPLDLEPLEEVNPPHSIQPHVVTDELPAINDEDVLDPTSEIKKEPLLDLYDIASSSTLAYQSTSPPLPTMAYPPISIPSYTETPNYPVDDSLSMARITGSNDNPRITIETMPQLPQPQNFEPQSTIDSTDVLELQDNAIAAQPPIFEPFAESMTEQTSSNSNYSYHPIYSEPIEEPAILETSDTEVANSTPYNLEDSSSELEIEETSSQLDLEQEPAQYYLENESVYSDEPLADLVTPELENQPDYASSYYQSNYQEQSPTDDVLDEEETSAPIAEEVTGTATTANLYQQVPMLPTPPIPPIPPMLPMLPPMLPVLSVPLPPVLPMPELPPVPPVLHITPRSDLPTLPSMPALELPSEPPPPMVNHPIAVVAPMAITSIDQIPQHLVDEIVRRVVAQLSESVVREIAWEVVPDLAQIMIKKQLSQNNGK